MVTIGVPRHMQMIIPRKPGQRVMAVVVVSMFMKGRRLWLIHKKDLSGIMLRKRVKATGHTGSSPTITNRISKRCKDIFVNPTLLGMKTSAIPQDLANGSAILILY